MISLKRNFLLASVLGLEQPKSPGRRSRQMAVLYSGKQPCSSSSAAIGRWPQVNNLEANREKAGLGAGRVTRVLMAKGSLN